MNSLESSELWTRIAHLHKRARRRYAAVAYVSDDTAVRFTTGDLLIADVSDEAISSGQTSAAVIERAVEAGAAVYSLPRLHAKLMVFDETVVVGSQNISQSSRSDLHEVGLITTDKTVHRRARALIQRLRRDAVRVDAEEVARLLAIPVVRRSGHTPEDKISLLSAMREGSPLLRDFVFCLWHDVPTLSFAEIRQQARSRNLKMPEYSRWDHFEDYSEDFRRDRGKLLGSYRTLFEKLERKVISIEVVEDERYERIKRFVQLDTDMLIYVNHFEHKNRIVGNFKRDRGAPFKLGGVDAKRFVSLLNKGINAAPKLAHEIWSIPGWVVEPSTLRNLLRFGEQAFE